ncbi:RxLR-like protein [Plasmopara halstedii]|uniref:RxLR-like protein n=1 Tax=Plasmopara halstedii TaxID=4781 RepID=A0A0N7L6H1_PLAHL|nr:RxLR-like protein [Plasmopara halstedii]CEG44259.1 RxLR-like protein [Plasmopara halstedii]|eukprot:XP_024580628.1 RxLR-like protein [Plasmopara halstedii]
MNRSFALSLIVVTFTSSWATTSVAGNEDTIATKHVLCHDDDAPVCGSDNKTYPNACILRCFNVTMAYGGICDDRIMDKQGAHWLSSLTNEHMGLIRNHANSNPADEDGIFFRKVFQA